MVEKLYLERHKDLSHVSAAILDVVEELDAAYENGHCPRPENLYMYDYFRKVFAPGDLVVLSGNSAMRNSFLFAEIVNQVAYDSCCVLSRDSKLFARDLLMKKTGLSNKKICGREWFADEDWNCFTDAIAQLNSSGLLLGGIPSNVGELDAIIKGEIIRSGMRGDEVRYQLFVDNLTPLLEVPRVEDQSSSSALSSVLSELKRVAVARRLLVCVVHHAHEASWVEEQSIIDRYADATFSLRSRPDQHAFGQEPNCTFSMKIKGRAVVDATELRIDTLL